MRQSSYNDKLWYTFNGEFFGDKKKCEEREKILLQYKDVFDEIERYDFQEKRETDYSYLNPGYVVKLKNQEEVEAFSIFYSGEYFPTPKEAGVYLYKTSEDRGFYNFYSIKETDRKKLPLNVRLYLFAKELEAEN